MDYLDKIKPYSKEVHNLTREQCFLLVEKLLPEHLSLIRQRLYFLDKDKRERLRNYEIESDFLSSFKIMVNVKEVCPFNGFEPSNKYLIDFQKEMEEIKECNPDFENWLD